MAKRKFVAVRQDSASAQSFSFKELRKKLYAETTEYVIIYQNFSDGAESSVSLAITEDGEVLYEEDGYASKASPGPRIWDMLDKAQEKAEKELRACKKIRKALGKVREFGPGPDSASTFSGLLKRMDGD